jgi:hypothetical protein
LNFQNNHIMTLWRHDGDTLWSFHDSVYFGSANSDAILSRIGVDRGGLENHIKEKAVYNIFNPMIDRTIIILNLPYPVDLEARKARVSQGIANVNRYLGRLIQHVCSPDFAATQLGEGLNYAPIRWPIERA